jgi:hypothetical protein
LCIISLITIHCIDRNNEFHKRLDLWREQTKAQYEKTCRNAKKTYEKELQKIKMAENDWMDAMNLINPGEAYRLLKGWSQHIKRMRSYKIHAPNNILCIRNFPFPELICDCDKRPCHCTELRDRNRDVCTHFYSSEGEEGFELTKCIQTIFAAYGVIHESMTYDVFIKKRCKYARESMRAVQINGEREFEKVMERTSPNKNADHSCVTSTATTVEKSEQIKMTTPTGNEESALLSLLDNETRDMVVVCSTSPETVSIATSVCLPSVVVPTSTEFTLSTTTTPSSPQLSLAIPSQTP